MRLKNAINMKHQAKQAEEVTIFAGSLAWDFAKHYEETGKTALESTFDNVLPSNITMPIILPNEVLDNLSAYRIAPKRAKVIHLHRANNAAEISSGGGLSGITINLLCSSLVKQSKAEQVYLYDESGSLLENLSGYIKRLRDDPQTQEIAQLVQSTTEQETPERVANYADYFKTLGDNEKVNAFLKWYKKPMRYDDVKQTIYYYTGKKWQSQTDLETGREVRNFYNEKEIKYSVRKIESLIDLFKYELEPMGKRNTQVLAFRNGALNKHTGEFSPHRQEDYLTSFIDIDYTDKPIPTPNFNKWLAWVSEDKPEKRQRILAALYMVLTNRHEWQLFLEITGVGGSGKSIFNEIARLLAGEDNSTSITLKELESPVIRCKIIDKTLIYSADQEAYIGDGAELRAFSGGDRLGFNPKYKDPFDAQVQAIFMMTNNTAIIFKEAKGGIARRRVIFHFNRKVPEHLRDNQLKSKLKAESGGIVRLLLDSFKNADEAESLLHQQRESLEALKVKRETDHILSFASHFTTKEEINGLTVGSTRNSIDSERRSLYSAYLFYCECIGHYKPLNRTRFLEAFEQALKENQAQNPFRRRMKDGRNMTNVYYIDLNQTMTDWNS